VQVFILTNPNLKPDYAEALFYFIDYLLYLPDELTKQLTKDLSINIEKEAKHMLYSEKLKEAPTFAEYLKTVREEGFEKGIEKGIEKGKMEEKRNLAAELLREGFSVEKVAKIMKLSLDEVKEIEGSL
jgi:predicted transposase/invertase (TIGR01784 family)